MKDSEFIELLNLYLDHEISAEDAARLEAEVQRSPQRRRVYQDYCRMQKACVMLAQTAETAPESERGNVLAFEPRRSWGFPTYAAGLFAAAACVALVFVVRNRTAAPTDQPGLIAPQAVAPVAAVDSAPPRAIARTVSVTPRNTSELKPVFTAHALALSSNAAGDRTVEVAPATDARFEWMNRVQLSTLSRVPAEELVFETKASSLTESRTFRGQRLIDAQVERAAFQFQR